MCSSDLDDTDSFHDSNLAFIRVLFVVYISVSTIIFLNLLIAMLNATYDDAVKNAKIAIIADNMRMLSRIMWWEQRIPSVVRYVLHVASGTNTLKQITDEMRWRLTISPEGTPSASELYDNKTNPLEVQRRIAALEEHNQIVERKLDKKLTTLECTLIEKFDKKIEIISQQTKELDHYCKERDDKLSSMEGKIDQLLHNFKRRRKRL